MNSFGAAKPGRADPFQHANLDAMTPPREHALFRVQKKTPGNQLRRAWCLDACRVDRVIRKHPKSGDGMFRIGI
jgi:hypothetical protein